MTDNERLYSALPLIFSRVKINERAKEALRRKLFNALTLTDEDLDFAAAAGDLTAKNQKEENERET